jgi:hypothetical protein
MVEPSPFIDASRPDEVRYWSRALGIEEQRLLLAMEIVGPRLSDIRRHIEDPQAHQ